jgi:hypothetical protein
MIAAIAGHGLAAHDSRSYCESIAGTRQSQTRPIRSGQTNGANDAGTTHRSLLVERVECFPEIHAKGLDCLRNV